MKKSGNFSLLLKYAGSFPPEAKKDYKEKISLIGNVHLFAITENTKSSDSMAVVSPLPNMDASNLLSYLVLQTSFVTVESISSLESHSIKNETGL